MEYRELPHGGEKIGVIGLGAAQLGAAPHNDAILRNPVVCSTISRHAYLRKRRLIGTCRPNAGTRTFFRTPSELLPVRQCAIFSYTLLQWPGVRHGPPSSTVRRA